MKVSLNTMITYPVAIALERYMKRSKARRPDVVNEALEEYLQKRGEKL